MEMWLEVVGRTDGQRRGKQLPLTARQEQAQNPKEYSIRSLLLIQAM